MTTSLIPPAQQGTSVWNYTVKYGDPPLRVYSLGEIATIAEDLSLGYLDLLGPAELVELKRDFPKLKVASAVMLDYDGNGNPPFKIGPNNPTNHDLFVRNTKALIDAAAAHGNCKRVTVFFGDMHENGVSGTGTLIHPDDGVMNCVAAFKRVVGHAEKKGITLVLEMLNSLDRGHPMKGHPGYQGNSISICNRVIQEVGSEFLKLLFDIYHVSLMEEREPDALITELGTDVIGMVHTAGKEDRQETYLDTEVNQGRCMQALVNIGYDGPIVHEFLPTVADVRRGLKFSASFSVGV